MSELNQAADAAPPVLRSALDANATVKLGPFSRGGKSRVAVAACDHDFQPDATLTPVGSFLPATDERFLSLVSSMVTRDCWVDRLIQWWARVRERVAHSTTLVLNLDNGPENHSRRTQCRLRLLALAQASGLSLRLAYYPPSHSKDNPVERCWGIRAHHWHGRLRDAVEAVQAFAASMTWQGQHRVVAVVTTVYQTGVQRTKHAMDHVDAHLKRLPALEKWRVDLTGPSPAIREV